MAGQRGRALASTGVVVAVAIVVIANVRLFTWWLAPVMLAAEFTVVVLAGLATSIIRSVCRNRNAVSPRT